MTQDLVYTIENLSRVIGYGAMQAAAVGAATYLGLSVFRGLQSGTTVPQQLNNKTNKVAGVAAGALTILANGNHHDLGQLAHVAAEALPVAATGALVGGFIGGLREMGRNSAPSRDSVQKYALRGAIGGAIALPVALSVAHYFR